MFASLTDCLIPGYRTTVHTAVAAIEISVTLIKHVFIVDRGLEGRTRRGNGGAKRAPGRQKRAAWAAGRGDTPSPIVLTQRFDSLQTVNRSSQYATGKTLYFSSDNTAFLFSEDTHVHIAI